jgi:hypothetical protein
MNDSPLQNHVHTRRNPFGLSFLAIVGLSLLAMPRAVLHDLRIVTEENPLTWLLVFGPIAIWIAVAVVKKVPSPFLTLLMIGLSYGFFLMLGHQILWDQNFQGNPPDLDGPVSGVVARVAVFFSSIFTGAIVGSVSGLIAWGISAILKRRASA